MGGAVGGVFLIATVGILGYLYGRRRSILSGENEKQDGQDAITSFAGYQGPYTITPNQPNPGYVHHQSLNPSMPASAPVEQGETI